MYRMAICIFHIWGWLFCRALQCWIISNSIRCVALYFIFVSTAVLCHIVIDDFTSSDCSSLSCCFVLLYRYLPCYLILLSMFTAFLMFWNLWSSTIPDSSLLAFLTSNWSLFPFYLYYFLLFSRLFSFSTTAFSGAVTTDWSSNCFVHCRDENVLETFKFWIVAIQFFTLKLIQK